MRLQITWQVNFSQPPSYIVHPHLSSHSEVLVVLVMQSWASRLKTWVSAWCTCRPAKAKLRLERLMTHPNVHHKQRCRVCRVWQWRSHRRCQTLPVLQIGIGDLHMVLAVSARAVVLVVPGVLVVPACPVAVLVVPLVVHVHVHVPVLPVLPVLRVLRVLDQPRMDLDPILMVAMDLAPINGIFGDLKVGLVVRISASCFPENHVMRQRQMAKSGQGNGGMMRELHGKRELDSDAWF